MALSVEQCSPADAPLINIAEVARYVGRSPAAVRQTMVRAHHGDPDTLGRALLDIKVNIGRRVMFRKPDLLEWLKARE